MKTSLSVWIRLNLLLLACLVILRLLFFFEIHFRIEAGWDVFPTVMSGVLFDVILLFRVFVYGLIPFVLVHRFLPKAACWVFGGWLVLYAIVEALLAEYYCNLNLPLDHVVLVYTPEELKETVSSSAALSLAQVFWFVLHVACAIALVSLGGVVRKMKPFSYGVIIPVLSVGFLVSVFVNYPQMIREEKYYATHDAFCLAVNQPSYSWFKIKEYREDLRKGMAEDYGKSVSEAATAYQSLHPENDYDNPEYPFYRKATDPDVLGPFFKQTTDGLPPNVVFVIVEGLGQRLTGVTSPALSFTPFIDRLASTGLFWPNCFSTSERTFGVLPAVFASVPHGRLGFTSTLSYLPKHYSLLRDFKRNGYTTSFFYGGDASFDRYGYFMEENQIDFQFVPNLTIQDSTQYALLANNNRWGLDDGQLFAGAIKHKRNDTAGKRPYADVYLTLTTHEPFFIEGIESFEQRVMEIVEQAEGVSDKERENVLKNQNIYACYLYMDQCLKELFAYYASRPDFDNTLFVITGDHRMAQVPQAIPIRKYNVPLIIYSPLVKQPKTMNAVVSHWDITPSINAYLHTNYSYDIDDHCHWLGTSFDTVSAYRNTRKLAFMLNNRDVVDYMNGNYFISNNTLAKFNENMSATIVNDEQLYNCLKNELDNFQILSRFVVQFDRLEPPR